MKFCLISYSLLNSADMEADKKAAAGKKADRPQSGQQGVDSVIELRKRRAEASQRSREQHAGNNQAHVITPPEQDTDLFDDYDVDGYSSEDYKDDLAVDHEHDVVLWLKKPPSASVDKVAMGKQEDMVIHSEELREGNEDLTSQSEEQQKNSAFIDYEVRSVPVLCRGNPACSSG